MAVNWARRLGDAPTRHWMREGRKMALSWAGMGIVLFASALASPHALLMRYFVKMAAASQPHTRHVGEETCELY
jgi:hypothetical protein